MSPTLVPDSQTPHREMKSTEQLAGQALLTRNAPVRSPLENSMATQSSSKNQLLRHLYESLGEPDAHRRFLRLLAASFKSQLIATQRDSREHMHVPILHFDSEGRQFDGITEAAAIAPFVNPWFAANAATNLIKYGTGHDEGLLSPSQLQLTDFYQYVLRPFDLFHSLGILISSESDGFNVLTLSRSRSAGYYTAKESMLAQWILPHVRNVHAIQIQLSTTAVSEARCDSRAIWLLDRAGSVVFYNVAAEQLALSPGGRLCLRGGKLIAAAAMDRTNLSNAITATSLAPAYPSTLVIHDQYGFPWAVVEVRPIPPQAFESWLVVRPATTIVSVRLLATRPAHLGTLLIKLFDLTQAEARVAIALLSAETVGGVAKQLNKSEETIRSQLKAVFAKIGVNTQARLLRLLDRLSDN